MKLTTYAGMTLRYVALHIEKRFPYCLHIFTSVTFFSSKTWISSSTVPTVVILDNPAVYSLLIVQMCPPHVITM